MTKIKICGITDRDDAVEAARLGVDMLGFIFYAKSPRAVTAARAGDILKALPPRVAKVGVFVNEDERVVAETAASCGLDMVQFHGDEDPAYCGRFRGTGKVIKAFRMRSKGDVQAVEAYRDAVDYYLFDAYREGARGGTGEPFDWGIVAGRAFSRPVILSGGLGPDNVAAAIAAAAPYGVDTATGVERSPGKKDPALMRRFVEAARKGEGHGTG